MSLSLRCLCLLCLLCLLLALPLLDWFGLCVLLLSLDDLVQQLKADLARDLSCVRRALNNNYQFPLCVRSWWMRALLQRHHRLPAWHSIGCIFGSVRTNSVDSIHYHLITLWDGGSDWLMDRDRWISLFSSEQVDVFCFSFEQVDVFCFSVSLLEGTDSWSLLYSRHQYSTDLHSSLYFLLLKSTDSCSLLHLRHRCSTSSRFMYGENWRRFWRRCQVWGIW